MTHVRQRLAPRGPGLRSRRSAHRAARGGLATFANAISNTKYTRPQVDHQCSGLMAHSMEGGRRFEAGAIGTRWPLSLGDCAQSVRPVAAHRRRQPADHLEPRAEVPESRLSGGRRSEPTLCFGRKFDVPWLIHTIGRLSAHLTACERDGSRRIACAQAVPRWRTCGSAGVIGTKSSKSSGFCRAARRIGVTMHTSVICGAPRSSS